MNPEDFFKTAEFLNSDTSLEANLRSSISRSYYGIFLYFREYLESKGIRKIKEPKRQVHEFVRKTFRGSNSIFGSKLADKLKDLKQSREDADYDLKRSFTIDDSEIVLELAQKAISDYKKISPEEEIKLIRNAEAVVKLNW